MRLQTRRVRTIRGIWAVAFQAHQAAWLYQICIVFGTVDVMAGVAGNASSVHYALDKIVTLHSILMGRAVCEVRESSFTKLVLFHLPEIL